jgi:hypothetical protein
VERHAVAVDGATPQDGHVFGTARRHEASPRRFPADLLGLRRVIMQPRAALHHRTRRQVQHGIRTQQNGAAQVLAWRNVDGAATSFGTRFERMIEGRSVQRPAVARGSEIQDVVIRRPRPAGDLCPRTLARESG